MDGKEKFSLTLVVIEKEKLTHDREHKIQVTYKYKN